MPSEVIWYIDRGFWGETLGFMASKKETTITKTVKAKQNANVKKNTAEKKSTKTTQSAKINQGKAPQSAKTSRNTREKQNSNTAKGKLNTDIPPTRGEIDVPNIRRAPGTPVCAEALLWVVLAVCVILFLSNVFGIGGTIGNALCRFFFGVFGAMGYVVPLVLFFFTAFLVANRGSAEAWIKAGMALLIFVCVCACCELLSEQFDGARAFKEYYENGSNFRLGGGIAGGFLCWIFCSIFGSVGAWICLLVLVIISVVVITERSLYDRIRGKGRNAYRRARADSQAKRQMHDLKKERSMLQRQQRLQHQIDEMKSNNEELTLEVQKPRRDRIVSGVTEDVNLDRSLPPAQEIHEVMPTVRRADDVKDNGEVRIKEKSQDLYVGSASLKDISKGSSRAHQMVDSVDPKAEAKQMDMNFTIQRDGISETIQAQTDSVRFSAENVPKNVSENVPENSPENVPENVPTNRVIKNPKSTLEEQQKDMEQVAKEIAQDSEREKLAYVFPPIHLLTKPSRRQSGNNEEVRETAAKLQQTLHNFGVNVTVTNVSCGPAVTRYELMPEQGVKVSRIVNLSDDIKLNLAAADIRIEAPIPGKPAVGIEVPNKENSAVLLRELLESDEFKNAQSKLSFAVGKDIAGKVVVADIAKMPHLLIAGATGSGKSVCINTLIMSILYKADPEDVKLIMIDPKVVELSVYNGIPHLFIPVVTDPKKASGALNWGVAEMTDRYNKFAEAGVRDLTGYNTKIAAMTDVPEDQRPKKLPQIVIIVDELADLMMVAPGEVEDSICRLAQLARAAGIHLIIATQRPSVNVITGLIKANMPSRIAFSVTSGVDSRTIIDMNGAEKLLGKGDMLFYPQGYQKPVRVQGAFVSDKEVSSVTEFLTRKNDTETYKEEMEQRMTEVAQATVSIPGGSGGVGNERDSYFAEAGKFIIEKDKASIGMLQRVFKIGFNRAARIMDQLSEAGVVGPEEGTKPRKILMSMEEFERYIEEVV